MSVGKGLKNYHFTMYLLLKPKNTKLKNVDMLKELPFYNELKIVKTAKAFKKFAQIYSIKIIRNEDDPLAQSEASKDLFKDLLDKMKGLKYQITLKVTLSKQKVDGSREYSTVYFNSSTKQ